MSRSLTNKLMHAYFLVVIFPICIVYLIVVFVLFMRAVHAEQERQKYELELAVNDLEMKLNKIENLAGSILQNDHVMNFLRYPYDSDWEPMYDYLGDVQYQLHSYINYNPYVSGLYLYSDYVKLNPGGYFRSLSILPVNGKEALQGIWTADGAGRLHYYLGKNNLLDLEYAVEIAAEKELLYEIVKQADPELYLLGPDGKIYYSAPQSGSMNPETITYYKKLEAPVSSLGLTAVVCLDVWEMALDSILPLLIAGLFLFLALFGLLLIYLRYSIDFARRLVDFTDYIREIGEEYEPYPKAEGADEVGEMIRVFNNLAERTNTLVNIVQKNEILRKKAELDAYQSKIEPHFLYGTLESLRMMALKNEDVPVADGIFNLAKLLRYCLTSDDESTLKRELTQVERYLELKKIRLEERLFWEISVQDEELLDQPCPPFLLQPVVENSIKHGIEKLRKGGNIKIEIVREQTTVIISVSDDGAGISEEKKRKINELIENSSAEHNPLQGEDKGYALYNICMRIRLFYGKESTLRIDSCDSGGTVCRMWLAQKK